MITVLRSDERHHVLRGKQQVWLSFDALSKSPEPKLHLGTLRLFNEERFPPNSEVKFQPDAEVEIVTYVHDGTLTQEDSLGRFGVIHAGEFQYMTAQPGVRYLERNASAVDAAHVFQISFTPTEASLEPIREQRRFSVAERAGTLHMVASPIERRGALKLHQCSRIYSTFLAPGQHLVHGLGPGRTAWVHVVTGEVKLGDLVLETGDGAAIGGERAVSLTASLDSEILLVDVAEDVPRSAA